MPVTRRVETILRRPPVRCSPPVACAQCAASTACVPPPAPACAPPACASLCAARLRCLCSARHLRRPPPPPFAACAPPRPPLPATRYASDHARSPTRARTRGARNKLASQATPTESFRTTRELDLLGAGTAPVPAGRAIQYTGTSPHMHCSTSPWAYAAAAAASTATRPAPPRSATSYTAKWLHREAWEQCMDITFEVSKMYSIRCDEDIVLEKLYRESIASIGPELMPAHNSEFQSHGRLWSVVRAQSYLRPKYCYSP
ncbi:hypothetical protein GGX14DRAFT_578333 [Mycena pura]|uniref:Uncharacterized protein n=1 Tax=Mycena pura TaxID=153505 RepID=A0AAD6UPV1_9AGAR|nr:hypothetical protein GGX14DRAFT_578333 [Mycena pura]